MSAAGLCCLRAQHATIHIALLRASLETTTARPAPDCATCCWVMCQVVVEGFLESSSAWGKVSKGKELRLDGPRMVIRYWSITGLEVKWTQLKNHPRPADWKECIRNWDDSLKIVGGMGELIGGNQVGERMAHYTGELRLFSDRPSASTGCDAGHRACCSTWTRRAKCSLVGMRSRSRLCHSQLLEVRLCSIKASLRPQRIVSWRELEDDC